jgi:hypothetical protein
MTEERTLDELGPVDYLIVEFPAGQQNFSGEGVRELVKLNDSGTIRVMDILILQKAEDGTVMAQELGDLGDSDELVALEGQLVQTLAEDDVENLAAAMDPGSVALSWCTRTPGPHRSPRPCAGRVASSSPTAGSRSRPSSPRSKPTRQLNR